MKTQFRQGDVFLEAVASIPEAAVQKAGNVLAYGEATGHAHAVQTDAEVVEAFLAELDGETYLSALGGARIVHEEHEFLTYEDALDAARDYVSTLRVDPTLRQS